MALSIDEFAQRLLETNSASYAEGRAFVNSLIADDFEVHHMPVWPLDGALGNERFVQFGASENRSLHEVLAAGGFDHPTMPHAGEA